jgi:hypothetical protein
MLMCDCLRAGKKAQLFGTGFDYIPNRFQLQVGSYSELDAIFTAEICAFHWGKCADGVWLTSRVGLRYPCERDSCHAMRKNKAGAVQLHRPPLCFSAC